MIYFLGYPFVFTLLRTLIRLFGRLQSRGEHNVPRTGGVLICPNHVSDVDPPTVFVSLPRRAWYLGKQELFDIPVAGPFFRSFRGIPIKRDSADRAALKRAEAVLKNGDALVVFPEGRCSQTGELKPLQSGAAMLALRTLCPIVPAGLQRTNQMLPYGTLMPRFAKKPVVIAFGPPIDPAQYMHLPKGQRLEALTADLARAIAELSNQPAPTTVTAHSA